MQCHSPCPLADRSKADDGQGEGHGRIRFRLTTGRVARPALRSGSAVASRRAGEGYSAAKEPDRERTGIS